MGAFGSYHSLCCVARRGAALLRNLSLQRPPLALARRPARRTASRPRLGLGDESVPKLLTRGTPARVRALTEPRPRHAAWHGTQTRIHSRGCSLTYHLHHRHRDTRPRRWQHCSWPRARLRKQPIHAPKTLEPAETPRLHRRAATLTVLSLWCHTCRTTRARGRGASRSHRHSADEPCSPSRKTRATRTH